MNLVIVGVVFGSLLTLLILRKLRKKEELPINKQPEPNEEREPSLLFLKITRKLDRYLELYSDLWSPKEENLAKAMFSRIVRYIARFKKIDLNGMELPKILAVPFKLTIKQPTEPDWLHTLQFWSQKFLDGGLDAFDYPDFLEFIQVLNHALKYRAKEFEQFLNEISLIRARPSRNKPPPPKRKTIYLGKDLDSGRRKSYDYDLELLRLHMDILGVPGSGKTNTCQLILQGLKYENVPFLVFECSKTDYRELKDSRLRKSGGKREFWHFTPGDEDLNRFRWNPLEVPLGVKVQSHIEHFAAVFTWVFDMIPPLPSYLRKALGMVYEWKGWDVTNNRPPPGDDIFPDPLMLIPAVNEVLADRYSQKLREDVKHALRGRIEDINRWGLGAMFNCKRSISMEELASKNVVFELQHLEDNTKKFFVGLFLTTYFEYLKVRGTQDKLTHVTVIEEAHRVLGREVIGSDGSVMGAKAIEIINQFLTESRAFGEGLIIIDQSPNKMPPEILAIPQSAIIHKIKSSDHVEIICNHFPGLEVRRDRIGSLHKGWALITSPPPHYTSLVEIIKCYKISKGIVSDEEIKAYMRPFYDARPWITDFNPSSFEYQPTVERPGSAWAITSHEDLLMGIEPAQIDQTCARLEMEHLIAKENQNNPYILQQNNHLFHECNKKIAFRKFKDASIRAQLRDIQQLLREIDVNDPSSRELLGKLFQDLMQLAIQDVPDPIIPLFTILFFLRYLIFKIFKLSLEKRITTYSQILALLVESGETWIIRPEKMIEHGA